MYYDSTANPGQKPANMASETHATSANPSTNLKVLRIELQHQLLQEQQPP
jgi:hypothetical protein